MVETLARLWREQPLLVGCGCVLLLLLAVCGSGGLLVALGWDKLGSKISEVSGVDSMFQTAKDLGEAGFTFGVDSTSQSGTEYRLLPLEPREVSCEELKGLLQPHLVGDLSSVVIVSQSTTMSVDGSQKVVPVRCSWEGGAVTTPARPGPPAGAAAGPPGGP